MTENHKKYVIEKDIIEITGEEAIKNTTRGGNDVYINIEELENLAQIEEKKSRLGPFTETLRYINKFEPIENKEDNTYYIPLNNGGKIIIGEGENLSPDIIHLTNSQVKISKLKRKKVPTDFPRFLHFGPELIDDGILTLEDKVVQELNISKSTINKSKVESSFNNITMEEYFIKYPEVVDKLKRQGVAEYFLSNSKFKKTTVNHFAKYGVKKIIDRLTKDAFDENGEIIKKGIKKTYAEKKVVNIYQTILEPYKKVEDVIGKKRISFNLESIIDITGEEYYNNQILKIGSDYYNVKNTLIEHKHKDYKTGRYSIDEDIPAILELITKDVQKETKIKDFKPRNIEQILLFKQLINPNIEMHIIEGGSGSGKTVVAYAAALQLVLQHNQNHKPEYDGIILFKSNDIIGGEKRGMGFLPGTAYEKVKPFMKSYVDAHNLLGLNKGSKGIEFREMLAHPTNEKDDFGLRENHNIYGMKLPMENPVIEIEHLQFARGRTFENKIIFVDETQNFSPYEIKQLIERVGIGCKLMLVGDAEGQIDNSSLNRNFNGLTYAAAVNAYNKHPRFSMIKLISNYRSQSAEIMRNQKGIGKNI